VHHKDTPAQCYTCHIPLWTYKHPDIHGTPAPKRVALSKQLLIHFRHWFDLVVIDELHEFASHLTCQGISMSHLVQVTPKVLGLTATLTNGYASSLFPLLWRTDPHI
jgi:late competence protein required for DNA uptake (superfamily II DNA/RNA helicase)